MLEIRVVTLALHHIETYSERLEISNIERFEKVNIVVNDFYKNALSCFIGYWICLDSEYAKFKEGYY